MNRKRCTRCRVFKPINSFGVHPKGHLNSWCRDCQAQYARERKAILRGDKKENTTIADVLAWREEMKARIARGEI